MALLAAGEPCGILLFVAVAVVFAIAALVKNVGLTGALGDFRRIGQNGTPALGIILRVDSTGTTYRGMPSYVQAAGGSTVVRNSVHVRNAVVDVEVPGRRPYQVSSAVIMPLNMADDVLPGATVELRVDPKDQTKVVIVGPGSGFSGFAQIPLTFKKDGSP